MRTLFGRWGIVVAAAAGGAVLALLVVMATRGTPTSGQESAYRAPRLEGTEHPNLNGLWQSVTTANWDIQDHSAQAGPVLSLGAWGAMPAGLGIVEGNEIPYQPWALAKKKENFD